MKIKDLIEDCLEIPVVDDFNSSFQKVATYEEYMSEPGMVGDGELLTSTSNFKINLIYNDRELLDSDLLKLIKALTGLLSFSLPMCEKTYDREHRKWMATILIEAGEQ